MMPMLPMCDSRAMLMPVNTGAMGCAPAMVPMMPMAAAPLMCPPNNLSMFSTTSLFSEYDSQMYGRFRHVEREHPRYRHAPFDWYRPPKQAHNIIHEDAAVVTLDGPVPIGEFYRHYIYGDDDDYYDEYDDDDSSSFLSDDYDDTIEPSYEPRSVGYQRYGRRGPAFDDVDDFGPSRPSYPSSRGRGSYPNRRTGGGGAIPQTRFPPVPGTRTLAGDDEFDDAASVNSTYAN